MKFPKSPELLIFVAVGIAMWAIFKYVNGSSVQLHPNKKIITTVLSSEHVDTVMVRPDGLYEVFTSKHLLRIQVTPFVKFRSSTDTTITIKDTLGNIVVPTTDYRDLSIQNQYRIKEILITNR